MEKENLVIMLKYENKMNIYPIEQKVLCKTHYAENNEVKNNYQVNKIISSMPNIWCEVCNPMN